MKLVESGFVVDLTPGDILAMPSNATTYVVAQARDELLLEATRRLDISNSFLEHLWEEGPNGFPWLLDLELYHYVGYLTAVSGN